MAVWILGGCGVFAIIGVGLFILIAAASSDDNGTTASPTESYTPSEYYTPTPYNTPTSYGTPTSDSSPTESSSPPPGGVKPQGREAAVKSPLYKLPKKAAFPCRAPKLNTHQARSMNKFLNKISDCLDKSWAEDFQAANVPFTAPARVYWTRPGRSPCSAYPAPGAAAFYCPTNNTMYIGLKDVVKNSANAPGTLYSIYAEVLAHEYGHAVQFDSGILDYGDQQEEETYGAAKNAWSRRIELQAQCFSGVYLHSIASTLPLTSSQRSIVLRDAYSRGYQPRYGGEDDHGTAAHYRSWTNRGLTGGRPGSCNTWSASHAQTE